MRVGIITFHHAFNYGAFLQAEGLYGALRDLGHDPEIIDYRNPALEGTHERCIRYGWNPLRKRASLARRSRFIGSLAALHLSPASSRPEDTDYSRYETVIYGSDEIWNYASHVHRFDSVFFGDPTPITLKRVAYAPSLGELRWDQHPVPAGLPALLGRFSAIAVRDLNSAGFVETMTGSPPGIVVDPVFLHHNESAMPDREQKQPYVLIYGEIRDKAMVSACRRWVKNLGCKTVSVGYRNPWCDRVVLNEGPHEFLGLLRSAKAVLTTTFHGTMFSIKLKKPFVTLRSSLAQKKFDPVIPQLDLGHRILTTPEELESCSPEIDWDGPAATLEKRVNESIGFLKSTLE